MNDFIPVKKINELKEGGIPLELLLKENEQLVLDQLICPICLNFIWCPIDCSLCGNLFCSYCITSQLNYDKRCPKCGKQFKSTECKAIEKIFNNIRLKCPNESCTLNFAYKDFISHQIKCPFRLYKCPNIGCNIVNIKEKMEEHSRTCPYKLNKLTNCQLKVKKISLANHNNDEYNQIIKCPFCHVNMTKTNYLLKHYNKNNNIECLHNQIEYYKNKCQDDIFESNSEIQEKLKKEIQDKYNETEKYKKLCQDLEEKNDLLNKEKQKPPQKVVRFKSLGGCRFLNNKRKNIKK